LVLADFELVIGDSDAVAAEDLAEIESEGGTAGQAGEVPSS
jgi:hypothetical protein